MATIMPRKNLKLRNEQVIFFFFLGVNAIGLIYEKYPKFYLTLDRKVSLTFFTAVDPRKVNKNKWKPNNPLSSYELITKYFKFEFLTQLLKNVRIKYY